MKYEGEDQIESPALFGLEKLRNITKSQSLRLRTVWKRIYPAKVSNHHNVFRSRAPNFVPLILSLVVCSHF